MVTLAVLPGMLRTSLMVADLANPGNSSRAINLLVSQRGIVGLAHPIKPDLIGKNLLETPDKGPDKKLFFKEFVALAKSKGEGWVDYMWPKPGKDAPSKKLSYIYRVPGKDVFVGAGVYE